MLSPSVIQQINAASLPEALKLVTDLFPEGVVFSSSLGQEDQVLTDAIFKNSLPVKA